MKTLMMSNSNLVRRSSLVRRWGILLIVWCGWILVPGGGHPGCVAQDEAPEPLSADEAARTMQVPEGFQVSVFAAEPEVMQPIGFCLDDRGRLWVAEAYNYPVHGTGSGDRIVILEDTDGDGRHDRRTVFYDKLNYITGIEVGFGGVWVMSPPNFYFIPDRDGDDRPDAEPTVLLDGFGNHANAHNLANGFAWGPDGWLYGTHGRTNWSMIGKPGSDDSERVRFDGGVYRYHPLRHEWEPYADGTTNPWGIDWNDYGHAFVCNCVNPHLFQVIQGAHYEPWRGRESSLHAYQRIDTIADHLHFVGLSNVRHGLGSHEEDTAGGGHAHCGTMIYLGDALPAAYRNTLFTNNIHGRRINNDLPRRHGSGYIASHGPDLMRSRDPWFMGVTLAYGPGGEIYVSDWSDTGECHSTRNTRRHTGRIYRLTYGKHRLPAVDLSQKSNLELAELQLHRNDWFVRHARRLLQERAAAGQAMDAVQGRLLEIFARSDDVTRQLRALWALQAIDLLDESLLYDALNHESEDVRSWAVTLLCESRHPSGLVHDRMVELAKRGNSPLVRLSLASALQRLSPPQRWPLAEALARRSEDHSDQNLPLMVWYGSEPLIDDDLKRFVALGFSASLPRVRINVARRIASSQWSLEGLSMLAAGLREVSEVALAGDLLTGILEGVEGKRGLPMPAEWPAAYAWLSQLDEASVREQAIRLAVVFDDRAALASLRQRAAQSDIAPEDRCRAIAALVTQREVGFDGDLMLLVRDGEVRQSALRGLAAYGTPGAADVVLECYHDMNAPDRQVALDVLSSRIDWARRLLDAMETGQINAVDMNAFAARQIRSLDQPELTARLAAVWGEVRDSPQQLAKQIAAVKKWLTADVLAMANPLRGKQLFTQHCANCHTFFGEGGKIGPDITGAQRTNLDYLLENIIDPNASVSKDYQMEILRLDDGRVLTGLIESESNDTVVVQTAKERMVISADEVEERKKSNVSLMPTGLIETLSEDQIRDLFGYLQQAG